MPIYENTYKTWNGQPRPLLYRLLAFPKFTYLQVKSKRMQTVFILAWFPFILFTLYIYARVNVQLLKTFEIPLQLLPEINSSFFLAFLMIQLPFLFFFSLTVGPRLISVDIKHQALPMILSKPISRWQYIFGKFLVLFLLLSILSWVQVVLLFISQTAAVPSTSEWRQNFWKEYFWLLPKMILFSMVIIVSLNLLVLFFSSLTDNIRFATTYFIMFIIGSMIISGIASEIFHSEHWKTLSPLYSVINIGYSLFGTQKRTDVPPLMAWMYFLFLWTVCLIGIARAVRAFQLYRE